MEDIRREKEHNTDYLLSGKEILSLIFLLSFSAPLFVYLALGRTKYFLMLTPDQMNVFNTQAFLLLVQTFGALFLTFDPFKGRDNWCAKAISAWTCRLFFGLNFFAVPIVAFTHSWLARNDGVFKDCFVNVWFIAYIIINGFHIVLGIFAAVKTIK